MLSLTIKELLQKGQQALFEVFQDRELAKSEAEILLADIARRARFDLRFFAESILSAEQVQQYLDRVEKRRKKIPVAYILENKEFYGRNFYVNPSVLIPRPETEILVERAIEILGCHKTNQQNTGEAKTKVLDLCTGSGCIGLTLAQEVPDAEIYLTDISTAALDVARKNAKRLETVPGQSANFYFFQGDLFAALPDSLHGSFDLILCNPPYVHPNEKDHMSEESLLYEPALALFDSDPLALYRKILLESVVFLNRKGQLLLELSPFVAGQWFTNELPFTEQEFIADFSGHYRIFRAKKY